MVTLKGTGEPTKAVKCPEWGKDTEIRRSRVPFRVSALWTGTATATLKA